MGLRTEFDFVLPKGYVDIDGVLHREGTMRLATARDEIEPLRDRTIVDADDPYLTVLVLQRVISRLGTLESIDTEVIEGLFAADLAFLQDLYGIINFGDPNDVGALQASVLPVSDLVVDDEDGGDDAAGTESTVDDGGESAAGDESDESESSPDQAAAKAARPRSRAQIEEVSSPSPAAG